MVTPILHGHVNLSRTLLLGLRSSPDMELARSASLNVLPLGSAQDFPASFSEVQEAKPLSEVDKNEVVALPRSSESRAHRLKYLHTARALSSASPSSDEGAPRSPRLSVSAH